MSLVLVAGLGNPGTLHRETRHNVGFLVLDSLAEKLGTTFGPGKGDYFLAGGAVGDREVVLLRPLTYMNNSGRAVADLLEARPMPFEDLLVVLDDFALPLGTLRIRPGGSDGGHNGLASVIEHLQTDQFPRLRCGIGREDMPPGDPKEEFVLSPFDPTERTALREMISAATDA
ncbi:MAG: aminoacyl-tRNA hydrolase, partial [Bacteroidota bacterium]